jgi:pre-mRNA-splicing factor SPF27
MCCRAALQNKQGDVQAWEKACKNANAQLEHQLNRITNLELLLRYGGNAWRAQAQLDETVLKQMETTLQSLRK